MMKNFWLGSIVLVFSCLLLFGCKQTSPADIQFEQLDSLVWANPDSAWSILDTINYGAWQETDQYHLQMLHEFCRLKTNRPLSPDSVMPPIVDYFKQTKNYKLLGEALYIQGAEYEWLSDFTKGTDCLKRAEQFLLKYEDNPLFLGMDYYKLGRCAEKEQLYHIAYHYYQQALPFFQSVNHHYYLANCYRELARTIPDRFNQQELMQHYFDSASICAKFTDDTILLYEITYCNQLWEPEIDSVRWLNYTHYISDSLGYHLHTNMLAQYYLKHNELDKCEYYLNKYAEVANNSNIYAYNYQYLTSLLMHAKKQDIEAFCTLKDLYDERNMHIELSGDAKTVAIAKCYDVERERANTLQQKNSKLKTLVICLSIIIVLIFACLILVQLTHVYRRKHIKAQNDLKQKEHKLEQTNSKLKEVRQYLQQKDELLKNTYTQRLKDIEILKQITNEHFNKTPNWLNDYINSLLLVQPKQKEAFLSYFSRVYGEFLADLKSQYPNMSDDDMLYVALCAIGFSSKQIANILGINQQSVANKRQRIKLRLGEENIDIDSWIVDIREQYILTKNTVFANSHS